MSVADEDGPEEVGGHLVRGQVEDGHPPAPSVLGGGHAAHPLLELDAVPDTKVVGVALEVLPDLVVTCVLSYLFI